MLMFFRLIFVHVFRWTSRVASSWSTGSSRGTCTGRPRTGFGNLSGPDSSRFSPPTFRSDDDDIGKVFNWKLWALSFAPPQNEIALSNPPLIIVTLELKIFAKSCHYKHHHHYHTFLQALKMLRTPELKPFIIYVRPPPFDVLKETRHQVDITVEVFIITVIITIVIMLDIIRLTSPSKLSLSPSSLSSLSS